MEVLVQWVLMLLAILGLVQLGEMICLWSRRPKKRPASFSVLPVSGRLNDPQIVLDYFEQVAAWSPESCLAFVIDCGLDEESAACAAERVRSTDGCIFAPSRSLRVFAKRHRMEYTRKQTKGL